MNKTIASDMTKQELANTLGILLDMKDLSGQFLKMSLPALNAMYHGINKNLMAYSIAEDRARDAHKELGIQKGRVRSLERDLAKAKEKK